MESERKGQYPLSMHCLSFYSMYASQLGTFILIFILPTHWHNQYVMTTNIITHGNIMKKHIIANFNKNVSKLYTGMWNEDNFYATLLLTKLSFRVIEKRFYIIIISSFTCFEKLSSSTTSGSNNYWHGSYFHLQTCVETCAYRNLSTLHRVSQIVHWSYDIL